MHEFTGTSYLALQRDPEYLDLVREGIALYGVNNPISRLSDEDFSELDRAEGIIADELGCEAACLLSSGYLAGTAVQNALFGRGRREGKLLVWAKNHHPCLRNEQADREVQISEDAGPTMAEMSETLNRTGWYAFFNSVNSFSGQSEHAALSQVARNADACVIDISHSMFLWDHRPLLKNPGGRIVFAGSLGKASAFPAGFLAGDKETIKFLRQRPEYTAGSCPARCVAFAFNRSGSLRAERRTRLTALMTEFEKQAEIERDALFPVYNLGVDCKERYAEALQAGIKLSFLPYPTANSASHLRLVMNAASKADSIKLVLTLIQSWNYRFPKRIGYADEWTVRDPSHCPQTH